MLLFSNRGTPAEPQSPLAFFEQRIRQGDVSCCLLTPTTSMAEQVRRRLAGGGLLVRPDSVVTLSRFVEPLVRDLPAAPPALLDRMVALELEQESPAAFGRLGTSPGLRRTVTGLLEEFASAAMGSGGWPAGLDLSPEAAGFGELYGRVEQRVRAAGFLFRSARLHEAAQRLQAAGTPWHRLFLDGFYAFTPAELEILRALASHADLLVSLPDWEGARAAAARLEALGFQKLAAPLALRGESPGPVVAQLDVRTEQAEAEEIARRVLEAMRAGTPARDIAIVVRGLNSYVPLLRTTLRRFGVPARFYFQHSLAERPLGAFLLQFLEAVESGWNYDLLLPLSEQPASPWWATEAGDKLRLEMRHAMPAAGLPAALVEAWQRFDDLRDRLLTPEEWVALLKDLPALAVPVIPSDPITLERIEAWRERLASEQGWQAALTLLVQSLPADATLPLAAIRRHLAAIAEHITVDARDDRLEAVSVMDAYEARQWRVPMVFLCGLIERVFPRYHSQHPVLSDADRLALRERGVVLRTTAERQREERFLFDTVVAGATAELYLSCPRVNSKGEETLPSLFLTSMVEGLDSSPAPPCRPPAAWPKARRCGGGAARVELPESLERLRQLRTALSPTAVESFLQCPFQYFNRYALRPNKSPVDPPDRLDALLQGNILHQAIAAADGSPLFVQETFDHAFAESCRAAGVPRSWRTEQVRLELQRNLRRFLESPPLAGARTLAVEIDFDYRLRPDLRVRGKIDRLAEMPDRGLVVIDYKYSSPERVRSRIRSHQRGELVQGGLYLWAAQKLAKGRPAAMLYCGLRGQVSWAGWHLPMFGWQEIGDPCDATHLGEIAERAKETTMQVADRIAAGEIPARPADTAKCVWCEARDCCRVELSAAPVAAAAGGGGA